MYFINFNKTLHLAAGLFDATLVNKRDAVEYSVIVKTPLAEGGFEYTTDGANPPPIQVFLDEKYPSLKVTATTGVLNGDDILVSCFYWLILYSVDTRRYLDVYKEVLNDTCKGRINNVMF